jgi:hypothetical protein
MNWDCVESMSLAASATCRRLALMSLLEFPEVESHRKLSVPADSLVCVVQLLTEVAASGFSMHLLQTLPNAAAREPDRILRMHAPGASRARLLRSKHVPERTPRACCRGQSACVMSCVMSLIEVPFGTFMQDIMSGAVGAVGWTAAWTDTRAHTRAVSEQ